MEDNLKMFCREMNADKRPVARMRSLYKNHSERYVNACLERRPLRRHLLVLRYRRCLTNESTKFVEFVNVVVLS